MLDDRNWLTVNEAAETLGLTPSGIRHAIKRGSLKVERVGGKMNIVPLVEIERYRTEHLGKHRGRPRKSTPANS